MSKSFLQLRIYLWLNLLRLNISYWSFIIFSKTEKGFQTYRVLIKIWQFYEILGYSEYLNSNSKKNRGAPRREDTQHLLRNEWAIPCWICKVKAEDDASLHELYSRLSLQPLESRLRINHLRWYGHVDCQGRGRPRNSWKESVADDICLWNIPPNMVHDRSKWKKALKTAMKTPSRGNRGKVAQSG